MNKWTNRSILIALSAVGIISFLATMFCFTAFFFGWGWGWLVAGIIFGIGAMLNLIYYADLYRRNW